MRLKTTVYLPYKKLLRVSAEKYSHHQSVQGNRKYLQFRGLNYPAFTHVLLYKTRNRVNSQDYKCQSKSYPLIEEFKENIIHICFRLLTCLTKFYTTMCQ